MNRRSFLARYALAAGALACPASFAAWAPDGEQAVSVTVDPDHSLATIAPDFLGLGYEISSVTRPGLLSATNHQYVQLVRTLGARGVVRIGGNTADYASYSASAVAVSTPFGSVVNEAVLQDLGSFLRATGWRLIWVLNLGSGFQPDAIAEAEAVQRFAGDRLLAFEIGNEPDLFVGEKHRKPGYGYEAWLDEYRRSKAALRARFPGIPLAGPDAAGKTDWVTRFAGDEGKDAVLLTHHYYREGQNPGSTIEKLLSPDTKLAPQLETLRAASQICGKPYRICEVNSFSGGGRRGVSDTMAAALWVLDYMFTLAMNGCAGVNMETGVNQLGFISPYSPIGDDEHGAYSATPEYYGLLAFSLAAKGRLLQTSSNADGIHAYATQQAKTTAVTLINKGASDASVRVYAGRPLAGRRASALRLLAPAVDAKTGVTLGGAQISAAGTWKAAKLENVAIGKGGLEVRLPAFSAAIVHIA